MNFQPKGLDSRVNSICYHNNVYQLKRYFTRKFYISQVFMDSGQQKVTATGMLRNINLWNYLLQTCFIELL